MKQIMKRILAVCMTLILTAGITAIAGISFPASAAAVTETENNNTYTTANALDSVGIITASLQSYSDLDFFKVTPRSNGKLVFTFGHSFYEADTRWRLRYYMRNNNGTYSELFDQSVLRSSGEAIYSLPISVKANTTYCIRVSTDDGSSWKYTDAQYTVTYTFTSTEYYEREFNNTFTEANLLNASHSIEANLYRYGDTDYYYCTAAQNGKLQFAFHHTYAESDLRWRIRVYIKNPGGSYDELNSYSVLLNSGEKTTFPVIGAKAGTTYCIRVSTDDGSSWKYTSAQYSVSYTLTGTEYYEKEYYNNSYYPADPLPSGRDYSGNLLAYSDVDYFDFTPSLSGNLTVCFKHSYFSNSRATWEITVFMRNSDGTYAQKVQKYVTGSDSESVQMSYSTQAGTYNLIRVRSRNGESYYYPGTGEYALLCTYQSASTTYTLTYNANGGSGAPSSQSGNGTITLSSVQPTRSGYNFLGWSKSSSATSASYMPGASFSLTSNTTLYAVWQLKPTTTQYTVTFDGNGGTANESAYTFEYGTRFRLPSATRSGYKFLGWSENANASAADYADGSEYTVTKDVTLYAVWQAKTSVLDTMLSILMNILRIFLQLLGLA